MEYDDEVKGDGNSYTTEFRQYDPRLGRWLSIDPMYAKFPWQSPYVAFDNNPIFYIDPKGLASQAKGDVPPGEKSGKGDKAAWAKYTKAGKTDAFVRVLAPNGTWKEFKRAHSSFTYSDGKMSEEQIKKDGVWSLTNDEGQFLWDNVTEKYVKNTSDKGPAENGPPGRSGTTTYAGGNNPSNYDYSQPSQNLADQAGKVHDQDYDGERLGGFGGVVSPKSFQANIKIMKTCSKVMMGYHLGDIDPHTGAKISPLTYKLARDMYLEFSGAETLKTPTNIGYLGYKVTKDALYNTFVKPLSSIPSFIPKF
jgi:RHS repeat-associated protein